MGVASGGRNFPGGGRSVAPLAMSGGVAGGDRLPEAKGDRPRLNLKNVVCPLLFLSPIILFFISDKTGTLQ